MLVNNKTIVVTGGGNGIGRELVLLLLSKGAKVAAVDMNQAYLEETLRLAEKWKDRISTHVLDITDKNAVDAFPEKVIAIHGSADGIINNAGIIQPFVKVNNLEFDSIKRVMDVNFYGMLYMTKAFLPIFLKNKEAHIVNISSMGGFLPVPGQSVYGASKAAVKLLTEGLYAELSTSNVRVSIVFPGAIKTNIAGNSGLGNMSNSEKSSDIKMLNADKAAQIIVDGMENNKFRIIVGSDSRMMDILYRINPKFATNFIAKRMKSLLPE